MNILLLVGLVMAVRGYSLINTRISIAMPDDKVYFLGEKKGWVIFDLDSDYHTYGHCELIGFSIEILQEVIL